MQDVDLVIVGGGIAGGALATVMARAAASVLVLERQHRYGDHVRGEILWPWGVREARLLGIEQPLRDAGALDVRWLDNYDEHLPAPEREDVGDVIEGVGGSLNLTHPQACAALIEAAALAGADVRVGARDVRVAGGERPSVRWRTGDRNEQVAGATVVGADGRGSSVRAQAAIPLEVDPPAHLVAGMLVDGIEGAAAEVNVEAREADLLFFSFPQALGRARLYLCFPAAQRSRFTGPAGAERFLGAGALRCLEGETSWENARPAGPCGTFAAQDSRAAVPFAGRVVLIGDAAGYENPLQGQGLSMALRDARDLSQALLSGSPLSEGFHAYAEARARRQKVANIGVAMEVWANDGFEIQDPQLRAARYDHIRSDELLASLELSPFTGFDAFPPDLTQDDLKARIEAHA